ncbi:MAG TPA: type 4a pilus biogenesis protein PilO [Vicinamibacteria bacterium]|jgi:type IV pilus assembly protein PilO
MAENPLTKLPLAGQLGAAAAAAVVILGAFYFFYWTGAVEEANTKTTQLKTLQDEITKLKVTESNMAKFKEEVAQLDRKLETLRLLLPPRKETPDLMRKVQNLATQSNLTIKRFTPASTVARDFYEEWPISVDVEGTYHNLALFFDKVGRLPRLVNVGNLKVRAQPKQTPASTISASCVATTFVYLETPAGGPPRPGAAR